MRVPIQVLGILIFIASVSVVFTNCQQSVDFKSADGVASTDVPNLPPSTPEDVKKTCENTPPTSQVVAVAFPKPNTTCAWNVDGNLAPRNGYLQGRIEQSAELDLPMGATVCNMVFSFDKQQFLYDDHFLMTFDDSLLASSYDFRDILEPKNGLLTYDWSRIAGQLWDEDKSHMKEGIFCAAVKDKDNQEFAGTCAWPQTDVAGTVEMNFPKEVFYSVMAQNSTRTKHEFKFVSIGDNDNLDCEHSNIQFQVLVEYVISN